jgi:hypothetical protein
MKIWHVLVFVFTSWEIFPTTGQFPGAVKKIIKGMINIFFREGQLERNILCYESYRKNPFGYFPCW